MSRSATTPVPASYVHGAPEALRRSANEQPERMDYRRFGQTECNLSVVTLGGMRYPGANCKEAEIDRLDLPGETLETCLACMQRALDLGINHIETAHGYGLSERAIGETWGRLARWKREDIFLMTKGNPPDYDTTMRMVENQLRRLRTDYIDLYAWHGINTPGLLEQATGSSLAALRKLRDQGAIRSIGFSTHGPLELILDAINTREFAFINLHYYYFWQRNLPAVVQAGLRDMGVFIISPNDKGGQLFHAPPKLRELTAPLTPIQFNARFCLSQPQVHTLTFGIDRPEYFDEAMGIPTGGVYPTPPDLRARHAVDRQRELLGDTLCIECGYCLPCPEQINIPDILRFRNMWKAWDMETFGRYRYNMLANDLSHWFPGAFGDRCTECGDCLPRCPVKLDIPTLLDETHRGLFVPQEEQSAG